MYQRVNWRLMHCQNYNDCAYCGGVCSSDISCAEWRKATDNLTQARMQHDLKKIRYYANKIDDKLTYRMN